ncbi:MAG: hypothetical protein ABIJ20_03310 [Nanoarchaeota archaeon]|nr:hypothetical protein [Nanoarchaeota archaeon]MBU1445214.1 hypothetical protein [Nanoarchaeota archaeon]MBU2406647.1 hypothetical protein [Nanoarchaeota archaeon]MBU2420449.1 hypothetical protein [Nanoarchaeota archaeon]MBU2475751.1 hypothetical protein [Nanoarchaeota archaeon]
MFDLDGDYWTPILDEAGKIIAYHGKIVGPIIVYDHFLSTEDLRQEFVRSLMEELSDFVLPEHPIIFSDI